PGRLAGGGFYIGCWHGRYSVVGLFCRRTDAQGRSARHCHRLLLVYLHPCPDSASDGRLDWRVCLVVVAVVRAGRAGWVTGRPVAVCTNQSKNIHSDHLADSDWQQRVFTVVTTVATRLHQGCRPPTALPAGHVLYGR